MTTDCIFCKLIANEIPSYTIYENDHTRAFLEINPSAPGHAMVVHRIHGATILDYTKDQLGEVWETVQKVARGLEKTFETTVLSIGLNHGEPAGVHHMHVHIIPRSEGDGGGVMQSLVHRKPTEDLTSVQEKIKKYIKA